MDTPVKQPSNSARGCTISMSPGLSERHFPDCDSSLKSSVGKLFATLEEGINFYREYAAACGFDVRLGSQKTASDGFITKKWLLCNRQGEKNSATAVRGETAPDGVISAAPDGVDKSNCADNLVVNKKKDVEFLNDSDAMLSWHFLGANKNLNPGHQNFILNCARANIGPMKSFRLFKEVVGSYSNVGCTSVEFKNFSRDLKAYAIGFDAQMLLDKLYKRKERNPGFFLDHDVNESDQLTRLFWADSQCRRNYACFGDSVSLDATYSTNRYNLVFCPFTGKDNHGKCITFAAGLLAKEDVESYSWLLERFKLCMGRCPPMIITDQDPALKIAIEQVFIGVRQRLCMWHIMNKLPFKLPELKDDEVFKSKLKSIVWNGLIEPKEFEDRWVKLMSEYGLQGNKWLNKMFGIRQNWIPAYFRDFPMSGLFRTTSMSESVNNFFDKQINPKSNLLEFSMYFDSALDAQREGYDKLNNSNILSVPILKTPLLFEGHAAKVYTATIFEGLQEEIVAACFYCDIVNVTGDPDCRTYEIRGEDSTIYTVLRNNRDDTVTCSCKKFTRFGLLCRHIFMIFKEMKLEAIPQKYICGRWAKLATSTPIHQIDDNVLLDCVKNDLRKSVMSNIFSEFYSCLGLFEGSDEKMSMFLSVIREQKTLLAPNDNQNIDPSAKQRLFDKYYGSSVPEKVSIFPPPQISTKGSGSRLVSRQEAAIERSKKPLRTCRICTKKGRHDARTCPNKPKPVEAASESE